MRLRALTHVHRVQQQGTAVPGEEYDEADVQAIAAIRNGLAEPVDPLDGEAAAMRRLAAQGIAVSPPLGGGVPRKRLRPRSFSESLGMRSSDDPFAGWDGERGPLEQT